MGRTEVMALLLALGTAWAQEPGGGLAAGPMVGAPAHDSARIWAQGTRPGRLGVSARQRGGPPVTLTAEAPFDPALGLTAVATLEGLAPSSTYEYELRVDGVPVPGGPWTFRTLPRPGSGRVRIAFGSCLKLEHSPTQPVFAAIAAADPDVFVWLGDNCYFSEADLSRPGQLWRRMSEARAAPDLRGLLAGTAQVAQWDDHDYGPNNGDRTFPGKRQTREVFRAFWPNPDYGEEGEGIYCRLGLGPVDLFLLDNRWFRDPNSLPDGPEKTILGARQRAWLLRGLQASRAPIKLVATGGQFLARYHKFESWDTARHERQTIIDALRAAKVPGVVFISGDRHLAEVTRWPGALGYDVWDVTSSPLANRSWPEGDKLVNPERAFFYGDGPNFGWVEVDAAERTVLLELRDVQGKALWTARPTDLWPAER